jgi:hypothetical protein
VHNVVAIGSSRGRFTINEAFPSSLVVGEKELSNAFKTLVMSIRVQAFKDRVGAMCKDVGPCVDGELLGCHREQNGEGNLWATRGVCDSCPCIEHCGI